MISVCDFLDTLAENKDENVDKSKIFYLISHSEIIMNNLRLATQKTRKAELVNNFFAPVIDQLQQYTFKLTIRDANKLRKMKQETSASRILYKIRNEYVHQGNFVGKVFKIDSTEWKDQDFSFDWDIPNDQPLSVYGKTNLMYSQFLKIYFSAFAANLKEYMK